jgi:hypothetical protein
MDVASGGTISTCDRCHQHQEFMRFLNDIEDNLPTGFDPHLVIDNYRTHRVAKISSWSRDTLTTICIFINERCWPNLVERSFAEVSERCVRRCSHTRVRSLEEAMFDYLRQRNENPKPLIPKRFIWTADADSGEDWATL